MTIKTTRESKALRSGQCYPAIGWIAYNQIIDRYRCLFESIADPHAQRNVAPARKGEVGQVNIESRLR